MGRTDVAFHKHFKLDRPYSVETKWLEGMERVGCGNNTRYELHWCCEMQCWRPQDSCLFAFWVPLWHAEPGWLRLQSSASQLGKAQKSIQLRSVANDLFC